MNKMSKGERKVFDIFVKAGIAFKQEVSFKGLNNSKGTPLRFDFAFYNNGKLAGLLEIDGIQHFKFTPYFHKSKLDFRRQLEYDRRKNKFCLLNKIPLIRIPYWAIEKITLQDIFYNPIYRVKNIEHNMLLGVK